MTFNQNTAEMDIVFWHVFRAFAFHVLWFVFVPMKPFYNRQNCLTTNAKLLFSGLKSLKLKELNKPHHEKRHE